MTIALSKDVEDFLQKQVRNGACADPSELVNDLVRSLFGSSSKSHLKSRPNWKLGYWRRRINPPIL